MNATDRLAQIEAEHAEDHPYCTDCPLTSTVATLRAVLAVHTIERRYQSDPDCEFSYDTPGEAAAWGDVDVADVTHFDVCGHCGDREEPELGSYRDSLWPCPTVRAIEEHLGGAA